MGTSLRVTIDEVPQADGAVTHRVLTGGYHVNLSAELWLNSGVDGTKGQVAQGRELVQLNDLIMSHLNRMREDGGGRLSWNPSGDDIPERMVDDLFWVDDASAEWDGQLVVVNFGLMSPFPYAMDLAETTTSISDGATSSPVNLGTAPFYPVIKAYGPYTAFTITNESTGKVLQYNGAQPGASSVAGGHYIEFDMFRNTAYLDGDVANRKAGIVLSTSDFWPMVQGTNTIHPEGCDIDVLWQSAWV